MREDAISSIARVIFLVDWTERIRRRTTRSWAPMLGSVVPSGVLVDRRHAIPADVGLDLVRRRALSEAGLGPSTGVHRLEHLAERPQCVLERGLVFVGQFAGGSDPREELGVAGGRGLAKIPHQG